MTKKLPDWNFDDEFDGGEETCGRVIVNLHLYIRDQDPGSRLLVISRDPGGTCRTSGLVQNDKKRTAENGSSILFNYT